MKWCIYWQQWKKSNVDKWGWWLVRIQNVMNLPPGCELDLNSTVIMITDFFITSLLIEYVENAAGGFKAEALWTHQYSAPIFIYIQGLNSVLSLGFRVNHPGAGWQGLMQHSP